MDPLVLRERVIPRRPMGIHRFHRGGQHMVQRSEHWKDIVINVTVHPIKVVKDVQDVLDDWLVMLWSCTEHDLHCKLILWKVFSHSESNSKAQRQLR